MKIIPRYRRTPVKIVITDCDGETMEVASTKEAADILGVTIPRIYSAHKSQTLCSRCKVKIYWNDEI